MKRTIKSVTALALIAIALATAACNTTRGMGRDIEKAGDGLKESAERNGAD